MAAETRDVGDTGTRVLPGGVVIRWRCEPVPLPDAVRRVPDPNT